MTSKKKAKGKAAKRKAKKKEARRKVGRRAAPARKPKRAAAKPLAKAKKIEVPAAAVEPPAESTAEVIGKITCPRQRAVAARVGQVLDVFSVGFARLPAARRVAEYAPAKDDPARWRNVIRMVALGMVVRLGRDLGLATNDLHGTETLRGRTQVPELKPVQRTTALNAMRLCDAMLEDAADVPRSARALYDVIRDSARAEVAAARKRNKCDCDACESERKEHGESA
jgi:hypothetical protein